MEDPARSADLVCRRSRDQASLCGVERSRVRRSEGLPRTSHARQMQPKNQASSCIRYVFEHVFVRMAVAEHRRTPSETLAELMPPVLAGWNDGALVLALVRNENTDHEVLRRVPSLLLPALHERNDNNVFSIGIALSQRKDTPIDLSGKPGCGYPSDYRVS